MSSPPTTVLSALSLSPTTSSHQLPYAYASAAPSPNPWQDEPQLAPDVPTDTDTTSAPTRALASAALPLQHDHASAHDGPATGLLIDIDAPPDAASGLGLDLGSKPLVGLAADTDIDIGALDPAQVSAREAWEASEGHPPAPPPKSPPPQLAPAPAPAPASGPPAPAPAPAPSSSSSFPSGFAAFARSFALPSLGTSFTSPPSPPAGQNSTTSPIATAPAKRAHKPRPRSLDTASLVATPVRASFAAAQGQRAGTATREEEAEEDERMAQARGSPKRQSVDSAFGPGGERRERVKEREREREGYREKEREDEKEPPFDFQQFLDQMKSKGAEPVARYLRSFLSNFTKRTFAVADQVKLINDFLNFISHKMRESDVWRHASDAAFDNAMEGMEKLVMNRLYDYTFTPQVARASPPRPITTDDLERDRVLAQRIALFGWLAPRHLDVPVADDSDADLDPEVAVEGEKAKLKPKAVGDGSKGFLLFAQQELVKINHYKAPRDKLICILNCCKVIFGLIRHLNKDESADSFIPILIFVVLKANPEHLLSNVEFINRFRNPEKLQSEAGYYLSSLMGAVSFIETMDHTSLSNITQEEFEKNVESAILTLPASRAHSPRLPSTSSSSSSSTTSLVPPQHPPQPQPIPVPPPAPLSLPTRGTSPAPSSHVGDEPATPLALPALALGVGDDARRLLQRTGDTLSRPLTAIGRIFAEALDGAEERLVNASGSRGGNGSASAPQTPVQAASQAQAQQQQQQQQLKTPYKPRVRRVPSQGSARSSFSSPGGGPDDTPSRAPPGGGAGAGTGALAPWPRFPNFPGFPGSGGPPSGTASGMASPLGPASRAATPSGSLDIAGMQAEIDRAHARAGSAARGTLRQIFPGVDGEVVEWVLEANGGDLGRSIEALLEMS